MLRFCQRVVDLFPVRPLPVDLSAVGALPEFVVVGECVFLQFTLELFFWDRVEFSVAYWAMGFSHIDC